MPEDTSGIFKPEAKTILKIFGDADSYYQIPDYQRPYSWENDQIEELWDDLYSAMELGDESYFLGPMILIRIKDGYFEVVDGQQRLTTLTILFCVLRDLYGNELEKLDKELVNSIQDAVKSLVKGKPRLKLITQSHHQIKFEQEILNGVKFPTTELTKKQREEDKFINSAFIFKEKLEDLKKEGGIETVKKFAEYILKKAEMITITCSQQAYAIKLFQVLNTRGLDLSPADLIKSHLYGRLSDESDKEQFTSTWREVETLSKQMDESITNLLTYYEYYLLAQNPKRSLYEELIEKFKGQDPKSVIYEFKKFVDDFNEIYQTESKLVFSLRYLPNQVFWKAILTTAKHVKFDDFDGLCNELRKMYYSYWLAGYTTSKVKQLSFNLIGLLKDKKELDEIKRELYKKMTQDNVLKNMNENLQNDVYGKPWLKPLLSVIEYQQTDDSKISFIELDNKLHLDHILPEKWHEKADWKRIWNEQQATKHLHKIGNLTLLSGKKNIAQQNDPPLKKAEMYKKGHGGTTAFEISKKIIGKLEKGSWTEKDVEERQQWIIEQVETILGIKLNGGELEIFSGILEKIKDRIIMECGELVDENEDDTQKELPCLFRALNIDGWHIKDSSGYIFIDNLQKNIGIVLTGYQDEKEKAKFQPQWSENYKNKYKDDANLCSFTWIDEAGGYFKVVEGKSGKLFNPTQISEFTNYFYFGYAYELENYETIAKDFKKLLDTFLKDK